VALHAEAFDFVVPSHAVVSIPVPVRIGDPGKFNFTYPVTTNMTRPFFFHVIGISTNPRGQFTNEDGTPITGLRFNPRYRTAKIFIENIGSIPLNIPRLRSHEPLFEVQSDCLSILEGESCAITFTVHLRAISQAVESFKWLPEGLDIKPGLTIVIDVGEDWLAKMTRTRQRKKRVAVFALCGFLSVTVCGPMYGAVRVVNDARRRRNALKKFIVRSPPLPKMSMATQTVTKPPTTPGKWTRARLVFPEVSAVCLAEMTSMLH
jgi:hypothetical protein